VLVRRLVFELGLPLCNDAAVALYAALVCDTGRFQYDTTTPSVFELARELVTFDIPVSRLSRQLFEEHRFAYLKLLGEALAGAELDSGRRFVWTAVTQDMLRRHDVTLEEVEGLIDILRRTTEAEVTCVLKEEADGSVRVSLRSLGDVDVRAIAADNGGGGHRFAAGFESNLDIAGVVANIRGAL
jgi:phosphoesterase RecJ-like protein